MGFKGSVNVILLKKPLFFGVPSTGSFGGTPGTTSAQNVDTKLMNPANTINLVIPDAVEVVERLGDYCKDKRSAAIRIVITGFQQAASNGSDIPYLRVMDSPEGHEMVGKLIDAYKAANTYFLNTPIPDQTPV